VKKIILTAVVTLLMLSPVWAADVRFPPDPLLVASKQDDRNRNGRRDDQGASKPGTVIIKGKGGKVTGVEREPDRRPRKKK
jgi:hypothetical protein